MNIESNVGTYHLDNLEIITKRDIHSLFYEFILHSLPWHISGKISFLYLLCFNMKHDNGEGKVNRWNQGILLNLLPRMPRAF